MYNPDSTEALLWRRDNGYLVPIAIELRKAKGEIGTVYTPYDAKELWQLAKEIIASLDCGMRRKSPAQSFLV